MTWKIHFCSAWKAESEYILLKPNRPTEDHEKSILRKNAEKKGFLKTLGVFGCSESKRAWRKFENHIFAMAAKFSIWWRVKKEKTKSCSNFAVRAPYIKEISILTCQKKRRLDYIVTFSRSQAGKNFEKRV